jgi:hypothetical protein
LQDVSFDTHTLSAGPDQPLTRSQRPRARQLVAIKTHSGPRLDQSHRKTSSPREPPRASLGAASPARRLLSEPRDALPSQRHDDLSTFGGMPYAAAELIVKLAYADLGLQLRAM